MKSSSIVWLILYYTQFIYVMVQAITQYPCSVYNLVDQTRQMSCQNPIDPSTAPPEFGTLNLPREPLTLDQFGGQEFLDTPRFSLAGWYLFNGPSYQLFYKNVLYNLFYFSALNTNQTYGKENYPQVSRFFTFLLSPKKSEFGGFMHSNDPTDPIADKSYYIQYGPGTQEVIDNTTGQVISLFERLQYKWVYWVFQFDVEDAYINFQMFDNHPISQSMGYFKQQSYAIQYSTVKQPKQVQSNPNEWRLWIGDSTPIQGAFSACSLVRDLNIYLNFAPIDQDFLDTWLALMKREPKQLFYYTFQQFDQSENDVKIVRDYSDSRNHLLLSFDEAGEVQDSTQPGLVFSVPLNGVPPIELNLPDITLEGSDFMIYYWVKPIVTSRTFRVLTLIDLLRTERVSFYVQHNIAQFSNPNQQMISLYLMGQPQPCINSVVQQFTWNRVIVVADNDLRISTSQTDFYVLAQQSNNLDTNVPYEKCTSTSPIKDAIQPGWHSVIINYQGSTSEDKQQFASEYQGSLKDDQIVYISNIQLFDGSYHRKQQSNNQCSYIFDNKFSNCALSLGHSQLNSKCIECNNLVQSSNVNLNYIASLQICRATAIVQLCSNTTICKECAYSPTNCITCQNPFLIPPNCECPSGYAYSINSPTNPLAVTVCVQCSNKCSKCQANNPNICLVSCNDPIHRDALCQCNTGYLEDNINGKCVYQKNTRPVYVLHLTPKIMYIGSCSYNQEDQDYLKLSYDNVALGGHNLHYQKKFTIAGWFKPLPFISIDLVQKNLKKIMFWLKKDKRYNGKTNNDDDLVLRAQGNENGIFLLESSIPLVTIEMTSTVCMFNFWCFHAFSVDLNANGLLEYLLYEAPFNHYNYKQTAYQNFTNIYYQPLQTLFLPYQQLFLGGYSYQMFSDYDCTYCGYLHSVFYYLGYSVSNAIQDKEYLATMMRSEVNILHYYRSFQSIDKASKKLNNLQTSQNYYKSKQDLKNLFSKSEDSSFSEQNPEVEVNYAQYLGDHSFGSIVNNADNYGFSFSSLDYFKLINGILLSYDLKTTTLNDEQDIHEFKLVDFGIAFFIKIKSIQDKPKNFIIFQRIYSQNFLYQKRFSLHAIYRPSEFVYRLLICILQQCREVREWYLSQNIWMHIIVNVKQYQVLQFTSINHEEKQLDLKFHVRAISDLAVEDLYFSAPPVENNDDLNHIAFTETSYDQIFIGSKLNENLDYQQFVLEQIIFFQGGSVRTLAMGGPDPPLFNSCLITLGGSIPRPDSENTQLFCFNCQQQYTLKNYVCISAISDQECAIDEYTHILYISSIRACEQCLVKQCSVCQSENPYICYANCDPQCEFCKSNIPNSCLLCSGNRQLEPDCYCPHGQVATIDEANCACDLKCQECYGNPSNCSVCAKGRFFIPDCICREGFFEDENLICQQCSVACQTCIFNSTYCLKCAGNRITPPYCQCDEAYYDTFEESCQSCISGCLLCYDKVSCDQCKSNRFFDGYSCTCPDLYYAYNDQVECSQCQPFCSICIDGEQCISCVGNRIRNDYFICICPDGFYNDVYSQDCLPCDISCRTCAGPNSNQCLSCYQDDNIQLKYSQCMCNYGLLFNTKDKLCVKPLVTSIESFNSDFDFMPTVKVFFSIVMNISQIDLKSTFMIEDLNNKLKQGQDIRIVLSDTGIQYLTFKVLLFSGFFSTKLQFKITQQNVRDPNLNLYNFTQSLRQKYILSSQYNLNISMNMFLPLDQYQLKQIESLRVDANNLYNESAGESSESMRNFISFLRTTSIPIYIMNSLQLTAAIPLINTQLPVNFYEQLRVFLAIYYIYMPPWDEQPKPGAPGPSFLSIPENTLATDTTPPLKFQQLGYSHNFISNFFGSSLQILIVWGLYFLTQKIFQEHIGIIEKKDISTVLKLSVIYMRNFAIYTHEILILPFTLAVFLQIYKIEIKDFYNLAGVLCCIVTIVIYINLLLRIYNKINFKDLQYRSGGSNSSGGSDDRDINAFNKSPQHSPPKQSVTENPDLKKFADYQEIEHISPEESQKKHYLTKIWIKYFCVVSDMDLNRSISNSFIRNYHFITLIKKVVMAFILVFIYKSPYAQISLLTVMHTGWFFLLMYLRPFSNRIISGVKIAAEAMIVSFFICLFVSHINYMEMKDANFISRSDCDYFWKIGVILMVFLILFNIIHSFLFLFYFGKWFILFCILMFKLALLLKQYLTKSMQNKGKFRSNDLYIQKVDTLQKQQNEGQANLITEQQQSHISISQFPQELNAVQALKLNQQQISNNALINPYGSQAYPSQDMNSVKNNDANQEIEMAALLPPEQVVVKKIIYSLEQEQTDNIIIIKKESNLKQVSKNSDGLLIKEYFQPKIMKLFPFDNEYERLIEKFQNNNCLSGEDICREDTILINPQKINEDQLLDFFELQKSTSYYIVYENGNRIKII